MKIAYAAFDPVPFPKGSAVRIEATVTALARAGAQVQLLTPLAEQPPEGFATSLEVEGVCHQPVPIGGDHFLDRALSFRQAVKEQMKPAQVAIFRSPWEGLAMLERVERVVYEAHGFPSVELPSHYPGVLHRAGLMERLVGQEQLCLARAERVLTPSETGKTYLLSRGVQPQRVRVIPNSLDLSRFETPPPPPTGPPWRLAYMGTMAPWQGLTVLLEALAHLKNRVPVKLVLAGPRKGRWMRQARRVAKAVRVRSLIEFTGPLSRQSLLELLWSCHLVLAPLPDDPRNSVQGCCPIKLLEYMACGRPILSTGIRPVRELLEHGRTGWLVAPGSPFSVAEGIRRLLEDPDLSARLSSEAREEVGHRFPRQRFNRQLAELVEELGTRS